MNKCPKCGRSNDDDWPIIVGNIIEFGGCDECWANQFEENWASIKQFFKTTKNPLAVIMLSIKISMGLYSMVLYLKTRFKRACSITLTD